MKIYQVYLVFVSAIWSMWKLLELENTFVFEW